MPMDPKSPDLDELLKSIEEERTAERDQRREEASQPPEPAKDKGPRRGFLDFCAVVMAMYGLIVATPVGQLLERGYNAALGRRAKTRPLISYFEMDSAAPSSEAIATLEEIVAPPEPEAPVSIVAEKVGLEPDIARALVLMTSGGKKVGDHFDVHLFPSGRASFAAVGVTWPAEDAPAKIREEALIDAVAKLGKRLGGPEAGVAAAAIDLAHVTYAVDRARASGADDPAAYVSFRSFLPGDHRAEVDPLVRGTFALATAFGMEWPVPMSTRVSSPYGKRIHPVLGTEKMHTGTDLAVGTGTEIRAIADGRIRYATEDAVNGKFLKIDHGHGLSSAYCHASELIGRRGQMVKKGDVIMLSGATGRVSGPHLHFQMEIDRKTVNPELFVRRRVTESRPAPRTALDKTAPAPHQ